MSISTNSPLNLPPDPTVQRRQRRLAAMLIGIGLLCVVAGAALRGGRLALDWLSERLDRDGAPAIGTGAPPVDLTIAVSPAMKPAFDQLVLTFNDRATGGTLPIRTLELSPDRMVEESLQAAPTFQALAPDSSLWFHELEQRWAEAVGEADEASVIPIANRRTGTPVRFAVSPIVVVAWESVARDLGWPFEPLGWQEIQRKATRDPAFKWNHPSTNHASGLLATLAEFYAGAGLTRGLTEAAATAPSTLEYVRAVEATVRFYGEGEAVILERLRSEGRAFLDAFVAQEQVVIAWNQSRPTERLVAIYPAEGTLWADHPLALLELDTISEAQRRTYQDFVAFLTGEEAQRTLLAAGYRPADLAVPLDETGSPFAASPSADQDAVDSRQPQTTLQMPSQQVVQVVRNVWWYTKRPTNVFLVVDTSGSMDDGAKMERTKEALLAFLENIRGDRDQVGLVEFGTEVKRVEPLRPLTDQGREQFRGVIRGLQPRGNTALLDAVWEAHQQIVSTGDPEAINAIVVMTDGLENASDRTTMDLQRAFGNSEAQRIVVFTIGFGSDADVRLLQQIAVLGGGQFRRADETDIEELYRVISTYF
ncbi:MAG: VWA domain-containing protein [Anaerolineae bacterium]|jgi:Ca-activated chloride channel family protein|nr:VWA domain-containing protein [Anaerolineae bacterium]